MMYYTISTSEDGIRKASGIDLTDRECAAVFDMLNERLNEFIRTVTRDYMLEHPKKHVGIPSVTACVSLQIWGGVKKDYACEVGEVEFDCTPALEEFALSDLPEDGDFIGSGACDCGDDVFYESISLGLTKDWDGPFSFHVDEDEYMEYLNERIAREGKSESNKED